MKLTDFALLADQNIREPVVAYLRSVGFAVVSAREGSLQGSLDEVLYEIALGEPTSFGIVVTRATARTVRLPARKAILAQADALVSAARGAQRVLPETAERR